MPVRQFPILLLTGPSRSAKAALLDLVLSGPAGEHTLVIENEPGHVRSHRLLAHGRDAGTAARIRPCFCCLPVASWTATLRDATWRFSRGGVCQFNAVVLVASARADSADLKAALAVDAPAARCMGTLLAVDDTAWHDETGGEDAAREWLQAADWVWTGEEEVVADRLFKRIADICPRASRVRATELMRLMTNFAPSVQPAATA